MYSSSHTNIAQCKPMSIWLYSTLNLKGGTLRKLAINAADNASRIVVEGNSTLKDVTIAWWSNTSKKEAFIILDGHQVVLENVSQSNVNTSRGTIVVIENSTVTMKGTTRLANSEMEVWHSTLNLNGETSIPGKSFFTTSNLNIASSGSLTASGSGFSLSDSTLKADGPISLAYSRGYTGVNLLDLSGTSKVYLNADGNTFELASDHARVCYGYGSVMLMIKGRTSISLSSYSNDDMNWVFQCPSTIEAPINVTGLRMDKNKGNPGWYDMLIDNKTFLNSTITTDTGSALLMSGTTLKSKAYIKGLKDISYQGGISYEAGAKIEVNGVCKKAASSGTYSGSTISHSQEPPSFLTGPC